MTWEVEFTDEFAVWWDSLDHEQRDAVHFGVGLLEARGPQLPFPYSSGVAGSQHGHLRELRIQCHGEPYRVFYAFDPRRIALLLIGGRKKGADRFYESMVRWADQLYDQHLEDLQREDEHHGKKL